ncbi:MAG: hypothetical protein ACRDXE_02655, partial [Acidimicrobiales bacterium]
AGGLATPAELQAWLNMMADGGPRFTGTQAHNTYVDFLDAGFQRLGLRTYRDRQYFSRWTAESWSLELLGAAVGRVPVASYYSYSGATAPGGVTGELVYAGAVSPPDLPGNPLDIPADAAALQATAAQLNSQIAQRLAAVPGGVQGRIVLMDAGLPPPTPFGSLYPDISYLYDPAGTLGPTADYKRAGLLLLLPPLDAFVAAGAAGVVFSVEASAANAAGQYAPFIEPLQNMPALIVDHATGARLQADAASAPRATLTLTAPVVANVATDTLWTVLEGETDELMIVNSHTDGPNVAEENGALGLLSLAGHLSRLPRTARRRGVVFLAVTGHFAAAVKSTNGWVADHQDLVTKAAAGLCLEHLGCREWLDDPVLGYHPSGLYEPTLVFHSQTPILGYGAATTTAARLDRSAFVRPLGATFLGEGAALHESGIPTLGFIPLPNYLLSFADNQHLDKVDPQRMYNQVAWAADLVHAIDGVPAAVLKAGDSTVLPAPLGGYLAVK